MGFSKKKYIFILFFFVLGAIFLSQFLVKIIKSNKIDEYAGVNSVESENFSSESNISKHVETEISKALENPPAIIKGVYVTSASAQSKKYLSYVDNLFKTTQINAVVIDVKNAAGILLYQSDTPAVKEYKSQSNGFFDINGLIKHFHDQGVYVIFRINIFNDTALAKARPDLALYDKRKSEIQQQRVLWQDSGKSYWLDPSSTEVADYNIAIAKDLLNRGADEINFDYIRFPSDGNLESIGYPFKKESISRREVLQDFFIKLRESLPGAKISADFFGQTTVIYQGDMGIGQVFEDSLLYFDYVSPMVYPSHYAGGFLGYEKPSEYPYEIIKNALDNALVRKKDYALKNPDKKIAQIRPWLQDFTLTVEYDAIKVGREIQATQDSLGQDFNGFMLWNASNIYTKEAVTK